MTISNWEKGKTVPSLDVAIAALDEILETDGIFQEMFDVDPADPWRYAMEKRLGQLEATVSALLKAAN
jgi:DNA-binding XRE family transcriptional regulator